MNTKFLQFISCVMAAVVCLCGCNGNKPDTVPSLIKEDPEQSDITEIPEDSVFVGEWICLRENSCNDKKIVLMISQENGQLNVIREMESNSASGSKITFSVNIPDKDSFYSLNTKATYTLTSGMLTESFEDGKINYFSMTGELSTNICKFPFCSAACGDALYCELHNTEDKRYDSLSDSNKKSIDNFIEGRYDYYGSINGGYSGDIYSARIMEEAADKYGLSISQIKIIWMNYYSY